MIDLGCGLKKTKSLTSGICLNKGTVTLEKQRLETVTEGIVIMCSEVVLSLPLKQ